jgi:hypothetical protein
MGVFNPSVSSGPVLCQPWVSPRVQVSFWEAACIQPLRRCQPLVLQMHGNFWRHELTMTGNGENTTHTNGDFEDGLLLDLHGFTLS